MANYCPNCGTSNEDDAKFCVNCGSALVTETAEAPVCEEPCTCEEPCICEEPCTCEEPAAVKTKSKAPVIIIIVCALVIVGLLVAGYFLFLKGGSSDIVGTWATSYDDIGEGSAIATDTDLSMEIEFKENGDLAYNVLGIEVTGTYSISGDKLTMVLSIFGSETSEEFTYKISGDTLTLTDSSNTAQEFTRK